MVAVSPLYDKLHQEGEEIVKPPYTRYQFRYYRAGDICHNQHTDRIPSIPFQ